MADNNKDLKEAGTGKQMKEKLLLIKDWIFDHSKIILPAVVVVCVAITVGVALHAKNKETQGEKTEGGQTQQSDTQQAKGYEVTQEPLEENAYPFVNQVINSYYEAFAAGDVARIETIDNYVDDTEKLYISEISKYIESYPSVTVYTKKGPVDDSYIAYVYSEVKFQSYENTVPGMQAFYVCKKEDGSYFINEGEEDEEILEYISQVSLQDDVIDLYNKVNVDYNDLIANDAALNEFLVELDKQIKVSVGEILAAEAETEETQTQDSGIAENTEEQPEAESVPEESNIVKKAKATDVVNIRSSDSETADKLGKAQIGDIFTVLETKVNGWSRVEFEGRDGYIKSEYLQEIDSPAAENTPSEETPEEPPAQEQPETNGYVTATDTVNVRATESETGERLGVVYKGEQLELIMKMADGWTKVKYKGQTAYVKSDYVE